MAPERSARKLLERLEGRAFDSYEGMQDLDTPKGVEDVLDHLRTHFEPIEVFRPVNSLMKAHVFLRKANLSAEKQSQMVSAAMNRYEYEPLRDAVITAIPRVGALRRSVPLSRREPGAYSSKWWRPQMKRTRKSFSSRQMRRPMTRWRPSTRKQWP